MQKTFPYKSGKTPEKRQQASPDIYYSMRNVTEHQVDENVITHLKFKLNLFKRFMSWKQTNEFLLFLFHPNVVTQTCIFIFKCFSFN